MSIDGKRQLAAAAFVGLLLLAVFWPAPLLTINDACCDARLTIDDLSFLGREAPSWDVAFWCVAGLLLIAMLHSVGWRARGAGEPWRILRRMRFDRTDGLRAAIGVVISAVFVALTWLFLDAPLTAWAEDVQSDAVQDVIRIFNRIGGGMNPALVVLFFAIAGVIYAERRWVEHAVAMAVAGASAGLLANVIKYAVGRTRPELWLGPFAQTRGASSSFPSGHTVGAFALASVLAIRAKNPLLRATSLALAAGVGVSRVLAFRHWSSDVLASALLGITIGWIASRAVDRSSAEPLSLDVGEADRHEA